jgi:endonuclease-3
MDARSRERIRARQRQIARILRGLERTHGRREWTSSGPCLDELVYAMLSQNTNVANAASGYRQLRRRFRSWTQVLNADVRDVQREIAVCGLARMRSHRLQALLREVKRQHGKLDLQFLARREPREAFDYLTSFFGIGPKTAANTLLFSLGMPLFPVDNGILRMCKRLKLVRGKARDEETSHAIESFTKPAQRYPLHVLMFAHAKRVCRPRNPKCGECGLTDLCAFGQRRLRHAPPEEPPRRRMRPIILSRHAGDGMKKWSDSGDELLQRVK